MIDSTARIHPTADLEAGVSVGAGSSVWHRAQVRAGARIGAECIVGRDAFIDEGVTIGDRVKIQNAALVYHGVTVEDGVFIGPNAILTNDRFPRAITRAGGLARADDWTVSPILLRRGCSIGAGAVIVAGTVIGRFATVGAGAVVTKDIPRDMVVAGNPAEIKCRMEDIGLAWQEHLKQHPEIYFDHANPWRPPSTPYDHLLKWRAEGYKVRDVSELRTGTPFDYVLDAKAEKKQKEE